MSMEKVYRKITPLSSSGVIYHYVGDEGFEPQTASDASECFEPSELIFFGN